MPHGGDGAEGRNGPISGLNEYGHSVAARSVPGVADARSFTLPVGFGVHRRQVYVQLDGTRPRRSEADIKADPHFAHDDTRVMQVESAADYHDTGHGVSLKRYGAAGTTETSRWSGGYG